MYDAILVATDGSDSANHAVSHALKQAEQSGAVLHAIYVVNTYRHPEPALSSIELETTEAEDWGTQQLSDVAEQGNDLGIEVVTRCCRGKPHREIIEYADEIDADLVVLGYQGHRHSQTDRIGSVTDRVVQNADRPVMVA